MESQNRKNKIIYVITLLILLIISSGSIFLYYYFDEKTKIKIKFNKTEEEKYQIREALYYDKLDELSKVQDEKKEYDNLDNQIEILRNDYFKSIKALEDAIKSGKSKAKIAYLTFDDGPYYNTYKVLDILDKYNVKATFFTTNINGEKCFDDRSKECYPLYKEYVKRGHTIANHTYTHGIWKGLYSSVDSFMTAVIKQEDLVKRETGGYVTKIVRFPGGSPTAGKLKNGIIEKLRARGYGWVDWSAQDGDGGGLKSKEEARANFKASINQNIEVVLFHDYNNITTSLLPEFIEYLQKNGYILLPLFYESSVINK